MGADAEADRLGRAIMSRRTALGIKRKDLALASGLSYPYLAELENGSKTPSARALQAVAHALQLTPAELLAHAENLPTVEATEVGRTLSAAEIALTTADSEGDDDIVFRVVRRLAALVEEDLRRRLEHDLPALVREELLRSRGRRP
jgi:transcriptional regulator with XRE-family HTH domain